MDTITPLQVQESVSCELSDYVLITTPQGLTYRVTSARLGEILTAGAAHYLIDAGGALVGASAIYDRALQVDLVAHVNNADVHFAGSDKSAVMSHLSDMSLHRGSSSVVAVTDRHTSLTDVNTTFEPAVSAVVSDGAVWLRGWCSASALIPAGQTLFVLPAAVRPASIRSYALLYLSGVYYVLRVHTDGRCYLSVDWPSNYVFFLGGVSYPLGV